MKNNNKSICAMFQSGWDLSHLLMKNNIRLFFVEGVDGVGKTSLLNSMNVKHTHFPTAHCLKIKDPSPFDYALDIVTTVYQEIKNALAEWYATEFPASTYADLYFDRGFMSTFAYSPTIIQDYMSKHEASFYYKYDAWEFGQDDIFLKAVELMMKESVPDTDSEWFVPIWLQFIEGLLSCPHVHIVYLPSYDSQGLVEHIKKRSLAEDLKLLETIGEKGLQGRLEERLEAYDYMRMLLSTLPMVLKRDGDCSKLFLSKDEFKKIIVAH